MKDSALSRVRRRLDAAALDQLRGEAAWLAKENDALRERLFAAEESAAFWGREATELHLQLCEMQAGEPGIRRDGHLTVVMHSNPAKPKE